MSATHATERGRVPHQQSVHLSKSVETATNETGPEADGRYGKPRMTFYWRKKQKTMRKKKLLVEVSAPVMQVVGLERDGSWLEKVKCEQIYA